MAGVGVCGVVGGYAGIVGRGIGEVIGGGAGRGDIRGQWVIGLYLPAIHVQKLTVDLDTQCFDTQCFYLYPMFLLGLMPVLNVPLEYRELEY